MKFLVIFFSAIFLFANIGNITDIKGNVKIVRDQKTIKAKINFPINKTDTIYTYDNSKAKIVFKDKTVITIGKNSVFKIEEYFFGKKPKAKFNFLKGTFVSLTGKIGKIAPKRFKLNTKNASIGIRGTIVFGEINNKKDIIGCSQGLISVSNNNKIVLVKAGEMINTFKDQITKPMKIPNRYLKHIIGNLYLKKNEIKTFFGKVYINKLSWNDYRQLQYKESEDLIKDKNFKFSNSANQLFFENLKNDDSENDNSKNDNSKNDNSKNDNSKNDNSENDNSENDNSENEYPE
jgi:hypothetical protein